MRYCVGVLLNGMTAGTTGIYRFRANSINDPDQTGAGHQALGNDQWAALYDHYTVVSARIKTTFNFGEGLNGLPQVVGVALEDSTNLTTATTASEITEQSKAPWKLLGMTTGKQGPVTVTNTFSAKKFFNIKDIRDNTDRLGAQFNANPTEDVYFTVFAAAYNNTGSIDVDNVITAFVEIDYLVMVAEPKYLAQS